MANRGKVESRQLISQISSTVNLASIKKKSMRSYKSFVTDATRQAVAFQKFKGTNYYEARSTSYSSTIQHNVPSLYPSLSYPSLVPSLSILLFSTCSVAPIINVTSGPTALGILGESLTLTCDVRGEPHPSVNWIFPSGDSTVGGGGKHQFDLQTGSLGISNFAFEDAGTYTCRAINQFGTENVMTEVNIVGKESSS